MPFWANGSPARGTRDEEPVAQASALAVWIAAARLTFHRIGALMIANVIWWGLTLPVITWPPATAGLYHLAWALRGPEGETTTWRAFWVGFRAYLWRSWGLMAADLALGGVLTIGLLFYLARSGPVYWLWVPTAWFLALWLGVQLYLWPLFISQPEASLALLFRNALALVLHAPGFTVALAALLGATALIGLILAGPVLLILVAFLAVAQTMAVDSLTRGTTPARPGDV